MTLFLQFGAKPSILAKCQETEKIQLALLHNKTNWNKNSTIWR